MKLLLSFKQFEALKPSQFRKYMNIWQENPDLKQRYKDMFEEFNKKYSGDKNSFRIYLPLLTTIKKSELETEIEEFLKEFSYEMVDYMDGKVRFGNSRNTKRIGQVLSQIERNLPEERKSLAKDLMKRFIEDPIRKQGKIDDQLVCISRHPYDIAGADTDRNWENCMTLGTGKYHEYLLNDVKEGSLVAYLINKDDKNIKNPIANCAIKPYINNADPTDIILVRDSKTYPQQYPDFENTVSSWLDEINGKAEGIYTLNPNLYNDILGNKFVNVKEMNPEIIKEICKIYKIKIKDIKINHDMTVDVNGDVDLSNRVLRNLPLNFNKISGNFWINNCGLKSLTGSPIEVGGDFMVYDNDLTSLLNGPKKVGGEYSASSNRLASIDGFPENVGSHFDISFNKRISNIKSTDIKTIIGGKLINRS